MKPQRVQRQRAKGWRMPENATYVGRPTRWGNPFRVLRLGGDWCITRPGWEPLVVLGSRRDAVAEAVDLYDLHLGPMGNYELDDEALADLRRSLGGKNLACWCPLDQPCHADVLLRLANP